MRASTLQYRSLLPMYYRNAAAAIVVYDITEPVSCAPCIVCVSLLFLHLGHDTYKGDPNCSSMDSVDLVLVLGLGLGLILYCKICHPPGSP